MPDTTPARRLAVVNGLRGVAILAVLYHHLASVFLTPVLGARVTQIGSLAVSPTSLFSNGWLGVDLFFVLSGFVLLLPYELGDRALDGFGDASAFYVRRAKRLLPLYYLCLAVALLLDRTTDIGSGAFLREVFEMTTFTYVFDERLFFPRWNIALWSVGVEVWFSLLFPLLVLAFRRFGGVAVTLFALGVAFAVRQHAASHFVGVVRYQSMAKDGPLGHLDDFVVGMALCRLHVRRKLPRSGVACAIGVLAGVALVFASAAVWDNIVYALVTYRWSALATSITLAGFALSCASLLDAPRWVTAAFTVRPLQVLGMMCYSVYAWHMMGIDRIRAQSWALSEVPGYLVLVFTLAALTYRFVEFPKSRVRALFWDVA